jgi:hypothetical protein
MRTSDKRSGGKPGSDPRLLVNILGGNMANFAIEPIDTLVDSVVAKAVDLYQQDMGDRGCIEDGSCECFGCLLRGQIESEIKDFIKTRDYLNYRNGS